MLDNEPDNGAEGAEGTTETNNDMAATPPAGGGEVRVTTPAPAKGVRRAAGPPPEPDDVFTPPSMPVTSLAGSGEGGTVKTAVTASTPRRRTVRAAGRPEEETAAAPRRGRTRAAEKATATAAAGSAAEEAAAPVEEDDASATRTRSRGRSRTRSAEAAGTGRDGGTKDSGDEGAEAAEREDERSAGENVFQSPAMLFQPPVASAAPVTVRAADAVAEDEEPEEEAAESTGAEDRGEEGEERPSRRRRRRGGRGRGRSRADEGEDDTEPAAERRTEQKESKKDAGSGEDVGQAADQGEDSGEESERGSRRRRRRRRRASAGTGAETTGDDPPNTVVRVREPRQEKPIEDEVQAVRGSTRLEAKKQRRREGREQGRRRPPIVTESEFLARREAVKRDLVIRRTGDRTQIAVLEDDILVEHYVDRATHRSYVGNVYLGRVQNVLPSMEAAFVDIGKGRNAVLYAGEVNWDSFGLDGQPKRIESVLKSGQSVLVQVTKDPVGHKGARLTSQISLPGRYLVYVPGGSMTGISRKLPDKERARLKQILKKVMPSGAGVIVRTAAEGASEEELERDITRLAKQWDSIKRKSKSANAPALLNSEPDLTVRVVRDVFNEDFSSLVVAGDEAWTTVHEYVDYVAPNLAERLSHWTEDRDVFAAYRIDEQINKALERKVWLPSGGSLVIDRTEAMTVVDVNTGKFTGQGGNLEETVTKNNLEAAEEIVRQLRLRDIGGIIVIDFIDMVLESNRDLVLRRMLECLSRDRTKHQVAEVTSLGLVQMTRKRVGQGLLEAFSHSCEHCNGRGLVLTADPAEGKGGGNGGNGGGRKKKKGKGEPDKDAKADKADKVEEFADRPEQADAATEPEQAEEAPAAEAKADAEPAKKTRKRASRSRKAAETAAREQEEITATADEAAPVEAPEASEEKAAEAAEAPKAEAAEEAAEAPAKKTRSRRTTTRRSSRAAAADSGGSDATDGGGADAVAETPAPAEGDDEAAERPKRRRTRRTTKAAATPPTAVDAG
ncbi:ribonuclease [Nocardiopsis sp. TSRI0078]|uniref:Rne/Rng family ribonuclease n=1 Tax=unclassified Nocardiopsis TaxID=2649073 RepID=UPI000940350D|nr:Rne/Rng family ribonuclease [Nocardiopsis sp. TSRI0078]OKI15580.1 ribonuclease [Nocardiopsis sp. TSRI0078]